MTAQDPNSPFYGRTPVPVPPYVPVQQYAPAPPPKKTRVADVAITSSLLSFGLAGAVLGTLFAVILLDAAGEAEEGDYGYVAPATTLAFFLAVIISHGVLYLLALGISIPLMITRRIAFYVPLAAGVLAAVLFWAFFFSIMAGDLQATNT
jgi:hypothetical protein